MAAVFSELIYLFMRAVDCCKLLMFKGFMDFCGPCYSARPMLFRSFAGYINS